MCPTIMLIEDDHSLRMLVAEALSMLDSEVLAFSCADDALPTLEGQEAISLLVTDIDMPGQLNGVGLANMVVERWPHLPIIVMSGNLQPKDIWPTLAIFLAKPFTLDVLLNCASLLLQGKHSEAFEQRNG